NRKAFRDESRDVGGKRRLRNLKRGLDMRQFRLELALGGLLLLTGCNSFPMSRGTATQPAPRTPTAVPSKEDIIGYLNDNGGRVQSVRCKDRDISVRQGIQAFGGLRGQVVCAKPRSFRMGAKVMGKDEVDIGSNDQEFW